MNKQSLSLTKISPSFHEKEWRNLLNESPSATFLHTPEWIALQQSLGKEAIVYGIFDTKNLVGVMPLEIARRRIVRYAYAPYAPVLLTPYQHETTYTFLKQQAQKLLKDFQVHALRINPLLTIDKIPLMTGTGWKKSYAPGQARITWIADLPKTTDALLSMQKKDTRYYMRRGEKKGLTVKQIKTREGIQDFETLMHETEARQGFINYAHGKFVAYWEALHPHDMIQVWIAYSENTPVAGAMMTYFKNTVSYIHGASTSDRELQKLAAPYYLHRIIMEDAIQHGYTQYNFWGVVPKGKDHDMRGLSDFKMKFAGNMHEYVGTFEVYEKTPRAYLQRLAERWAHRHERY